MLQNPLQEVQVAVGPCALCCHGDAGDTGSPEPHWEMLQRPNSSREAGLVKCLLIQPPTYAGKLKRPLEASCNEAAVIW